MLGTCILTWPCFFDKINTEMSIGQKYNHRRKQHEKIHRIATQRVDVTLHDSGCDSGKCGERAYDPCRA